ncbi:glycosyltransferase [Botrimarina mediterranea]|uniref:Undecaprenyl-phosphate mannosyltransferase n=1 Tax=Botrimarina mediterranea TaxID=2528022 RepID=A0A518K2A8_9BACT|nr:glycosyltransferase [Botrimarina mediterranea]QDV71895.1 Undecaprenyl-phosphate mannosyltransferase [Botrimarina mediterranea]
MTVTVSVRTLEVENTISRSRLLSVVVPVYNEHRTVAEVVSQLLKLAMVDEVVLIDDGSDDKTRQVISQFATEQRVRMLRHAENRGKGAALRSGFSACTGQVIIVQDADLEYSPEALPEIARPILDGEADVVYGSRELGSRYEGSHCVYKVANWALTWLSNRMTGLRLTDMETGCKAFRREVIEGITIEEDRFGVEPELTAKVAAAGWRIIEKPVGYQPRSYQEGKKVGFHDGLRALWCIARYSRRRSKAATSDRVVASSFGTCPPPGFTLIEICVVIAIIGTLLAIALPAVQMAREASRRSSCVNNLRQQALAAKLHIDAYQHFPTGGWGEEWVGDPDLGFGPRQPGGWIYNVLPFVEQAALRDLGSGQSTDEKKQSLKQLMMTPLEVLNCPSRRKSEIYPYRGPLPLKNVDPPPEVAKSDYAINFTLSYKRSEVIVAEVLLDKGMSKTLLTAEKGLNQRDYATGESAGDRLSMYTGDCEDVRRTVSNAPTGDRSGGNGGFGGPHPNGCNVAYGDGSVRFVAEEGPLEP